MAGDSPVLKRQREEVYEEQVALTLTLEAEEEQQQQQNLNNKRQKSSSSSSFSSSSSYNHILSFLEEEEEKLTHQDLSSLMVTLQQEISPSHSPIGPLTSSATSEFGAQVVLAAYEEEVDDRERVFRHLLEASDDELGLPSRDDGTSSSSCSVSESSQFSLNGCDEVVDLNWTTFASLDGLWDLEDEAANYYALLQSELLMEKDELSMHGIN